MELDYARRQCRSLGVSQEVVTVSLRGLPTDIPRGRSEEGISASLSPAFLPGRNLVFLAVAATRAAAIGATQIWIGANATDASGFPDCRPEFLGSFATTLQAALLTPVEIVAPLLSSEKWEIAAEAIAFGITPESTWSCYEPRSLPIGLVPCTGCDACVVTARAWKAAHEASRRVTSPLDRGEA